MWSNNSFGGNNGQYANNFNPDDFAFNGAASPFGMPVGQSFFPTTQAESSNGQQYFQPEAGLFNNQAFYQNQQLMAGNAYSSPSPQIPGSQVVAQALENRPVVPMLNARAAELKAQILKNRQNRGSSATPTPPVNSAGATLSATQGEEANKSNLTQETTKAPENNTEENEDEMDVDQLISQFSSAARKAPEVAIKKEVPTTNASTTNNQTQQKSNNNDAHANEPSLPVIRSSANTAQPKTNGNKLETPKNSKVKQNGHLNNGFHSDMSEGEIVEDTIPAPVDTTAKSKTSSNSAKDEPPAQKPRAPVPNSTRSIPCEPSSTPRAQPVNPRPSERRREESREELDTRPDRRQYSQEFKNDRRPYPEPERQPRSQQDSRDDDYRRSYSEHPPPRPETIVRRQEEARPVKPPVLDDVLPHDADLKLWLEITGYHNVEYRSKILARRRRIAELDAERLQLVDEMQAEEAVAVSAPVPIGGHLRGPSMPPPPVPNNTAVVDGPASNKRPHSDLQAPREDTTNGPNKLARTDSRRVLEENDPNARRPPSQDFDISRRQSFDRRDEIDVDRLQYEGRGRSRERHSPGPRGYDDRTPRNRGFEQESWPDRRDSEYSNRGGFHGRNYNHDYRGRGRGGGRGGRGGGHHDSPEPREAGYGSRIANSRPYRDVNGYRKGSRGDTRYFIVKSFNEENVLNCIRDSIWTTQVQNGEVFKEAFETCKNVILVFSINKSRAFQGFARMESLPGSIPAPNWQNQINWESAGAFRVKWLVVCSTKFNIVGHLRNPLNDNLAVLIGKDGQEIEENCGSALIDLIDQEYSNSIAYTKRREGEHDLEEYY